MRLTGDGCEVRKKGVLRRGKGLFALPQVCDGSTPHLPPAPPSGSPCAAGARSCSSAEGRGHRSHHGCPRTRAPRPRSHCGRLAAGRGSDGLGGGAGGCGCGGRVVAAVRAWTGGAADETVAAGLHRRYHRLLWYPPGRCSVQEARKGSRRKTPVSPHLLAPREVRGCSSGVARKAERSPRRAGGHPQGAERLAHGRRQPWACWAQALQQPPQASPWCRLKTLF